MHSSNPLVSVIIPAYNAEVFITQTLRSVLAQTYSPFEVLVVDDGSRDRTPEIVRDLAHQDERIRLVQQANAGVAAARNRGIQEARGVLIAPIDADDLWTPDAMAKLVAQFQESRPEVGVVYAWSIDIDETEHPTGGFHVATIAGNVYKTLICHNFLGNASATLIRKACLDSVGGYNTQLKAQNAQGCEDWDLYLRLAEHTEFAVVPEFLVKYRKLSSSMSGDFGQMARSQQLMLQGVQHHHPEIPHYLYRLSCSSFYLYLAQQSDAANQAKATLSWLWQAIKIDPITPFGRLGFYLLFLKSLLRLAMNGLHHSPSPTVPFSVLATAGTPVSADQRHCTHSFADPPINPLKIQLKVLVGTLLHQSLSRI